MGLGLILTGVFNIFFGFSTDMLFFALFWGLNGVFQGWGWPPCTKLLTYWWAQSERGFFWSVNSTSHNVGGAIIPLVVAGCSLYWGWRSAMIVPGIIGILGGLILINRLRDIPETLGLPNVETYKGQPPAPKLSQESKISSRKILKEVLSNMSVWLLALSYFFVYVIRTGFNDWGAFYLHKVKGYSMILAASGVTWFEVGGFFGILAAGFLSDRFFKGRRIPYMIYSSLGLLGIILALWFLPHASLWLDYFLFGAIGFLIFGPQLLVGLAAAEFVNKQAACTANGFAGCFAYIGAAVTGYPLGLVLDLYSWDGFFIVMLVCSVLMVLTLVPILLGFLKHDLALKTQTHTSPLSP
jgi:OPA family sugar phosphate sensor protein UhpC-like MFS transporter